MCPLQGLAQYGNGFLAKFEAASCANKLLEEVTLVDTPGVLSGEKQRIERTYNFIDVCGWFAARCDLILLLFDPHKLDISDEFKQVRWCFLSMVPDWLSGVALVLAMRPLPCTSRQAAVPSDFACFTSTTNCVHSCLASKL